jgi:hypothetical protein
MPVPLEVGSTMGLRSYALSRLRVSVRAQLVQLGLTVVSARSRIECDCECGGAW